jgi:ATP-dependent helicase/nuclease subunit A
MTVHAAKGLQAPIVFLPDTTRNASSLKPDKILWPIKTGNTVPVYCSAKSSFPASLAATQAALEKRAEEEYRRLLYVAMTRAEERLYIGGYINSRADDTADWYGDIRAALETHPEAQYVPSDILDDEGRMLDSLRVQHGRTVPPDKVEKQKAERKADITLPDWAYAPCPEEPKPPSPLVPSRPSGEDEIAALSPLLSSPENRFLRGTLTHRLLQLLPDLPDPRRKEAAELYLSRHGTALSTALRDDIREEALFILADPAFAPIFSPGSLAEVPVTGLVEGRLVSGQIDRLLVTEREILIVDYKTNRPPPETADGIPSAYLRQMSAYADTLARIYPGRSIRAGLLWTDGARLMEVPLTEEHR